MKNRTRRHVTYKNDNRLFLLLELSPLVFEFDFSLPIGHIVLKFGDMIDMDMKFCKRVSKFKRQTLRACPNLPQFYTDKFSVTTGWSVLKFWDMIDMDMKFCKMVSKGPPRNAPPYSLHKRPNISETLQIHPPPLKKNNKKNHNKKKHNIYCCSL